MLVHPHSTPEVIQQLQQRVRLHAAEILLPITQEYSKKHS